MAISFQHSFILIQNQSNAKLLVKQLIECPTTPLKSLKNKRIKLLADYELENQIKEEAIHDHDFYVRTYGQTLGSMSSGERKKAYLNTILKGDLECLIMVNPFDSLDRESQLNLRQTLKEKSNSIQLILCSTNVSDQIGFEEIYFKYDGQLTELVNIDLQDLEPIEVIRKHPIMVPRFAQSNKSEFDHLVRIKDLSLSFHGKAVLNNISWTIKPGEFWQLIGPNGSGKSSLISIITGDSPKGYGQDIVLFDQSKGSGESVWDIKDHIGYFTPSQLDRFSGYHSVLDMLISGLYDSMGLYQTASGLDRDLANQWLEVIGLKNKQDLYFHKLGKGEKRLVMIARAMIKHPPLLILDEPTAGLEDRSALFFSNLINEFAKQSESAIIFVSHKIEKGLDPDFKYQLSPSPNGSNGSIKKK